jgi:NAD(P)-dependent dehydrogenase (short-subunit alcohol dehydrogenase family)
LVFIDQILIGMYYEISFFVTEGFGMKTEGNSALVTGGASGLGLATAQRLVAQGMKVVIADLPGSAGETAARDIGALFAPTDVTREADVQAACELAATLGPLRVLVHCAGRGGPVRLIDKEGNPGSLETYTDIVRINLIGTFNTLRVAAAHMARNPVDDEDRPDRLCLFQGRRGGHDHRGRARPGQQGDTRLHHRAWNFRYAHAGSRF